MRYQTLIVLAISAGLTFLILALLARLSVWRRK